MEAARSHGTAYPARATAQVARTSGYRSTIAAAIREQRVYSPAGGNALSLQRGDVAEALRLIGLIAAADVLASALPRLRAGAEAQDTKSPSKPRRGTRNAAVEAANALAVQ